MLNKTKGFSLLESLIALFVLSMVTLVYVNSSSIFYTAQTDLVKSCLLYTSPSPRDQRGSRMPSSA